MSAPIFYKAGYPWLGPGGIIDGFVTLWNVYFWGIYLFTNDWGGMEPAGLVKLAVLLAIGYGTGGILAYYPIKDIDNCMQWAPTLFIVQRTIQCFFLAAVSRPRDRKYFYIYGTLLSFLHNLFIIENVTPALLFDVYCIYFLIGPHSSLNLDGWWDGWVQFYGSLFSIFRETVLF